ncbi:hypothetical protein SVAN01_06045 [Stagonosporopsis vannaccii]|nr:hypothetical protein SVAN01_06045 [Stagonosporopsis vannaccii]
MSLPPVNPVSPTLKSSATSSEAPNFECEEVNKRRAACMKKAAILRQRVDIEKIKLRALGEKYDSSAGSNAMNRRVWRISNVINIVVKNFNIAMDEYVASEDLSNIPMMQSKGGIEHEEPARGTDVVLDESGMADSETAMGTFSSKVDAADISLSIDFTQEEWFL